jgi:hypothetical protein
MTRNEMLAAFDKAHPDDTDEIWNGIYQAIAEEYIDYYPRSDECVITPKGTQLYMTRVETKGRA